jgi:hypothetical protein
MAQRLMSQHEVFGVAIGPKAYVFFHRVQEISSKKDFPAWAILGHAIAHELGHVLLGPGNHTSSGLMIASLKRTDLPMMLQGYLVFSPEQAARVQAHLRQPAPAIPSAPPAGSASAPACADCLDRAPAASPLR